MKNKKLLTESYYPSYMTMTQEEASEIIESFINIFKSVWSSVKLLFNTLKLNINVVAASWAGNDTWLKNSYAEFEAERANYAKEMQGNLKYFYKAIGNGKDNTLEQSATRLFLMAANPLAYASFASSPLAPSSSGDSSKKPSEMSDRLKRALVMFGIIQNESINSRDILFEAAKAPQVIPPAEVEKYQKIAKQYIEQEKKKMETVTNKMADDISTLKGLAEAKNFEELKNAIKDAQKKGIKLVDNGLDNVENKLKLGIQNYEKTNQQDFKDKVAQIKKEHPDLAKMNDQDAMTTYVFGVIKSQLQQNLIKLYNATVKNSKSIIVPNLSPAETKALSETPVGQEYLRMLQEFSDNIDNGNKSIKKKKEDLTQNPTAL
jgi:hypothetical protein